MNESAPLNDSSAANDNIVALLNLPNLPSEAGEVTDANSTLTANVSSWLDWSVFNRTAEPNGSLATATQPPADISYAHMAMIIAICVPLLLLQLTSLPIFLMHANYRRNVCFRILFTNGLTDCLQLGPILLYALLNISLDQIQYGTLLSKLGGAIVFQAWSLVVLQHCLLALNRLIVILRARYLGSKYVPDEEREKCIFNIAHFFCWTLFVVAVVLHLTPLMGSYYYRRTGMFNYDIGLPYTQKFRDINWYVTNILPIICFCIYVYIIWSAKMSRRTLQRGEDRIGAGKSAANGSPPLLNDYERRLLIQAIILYSVMSLLILLWYAFDSCDWFGYCHGRLLWGLVHVKLSYDWHAVVIEGPWLIFCGLNPILFIAMNKEFRSRYLALYGIRVPPSLSQLFKTTSTPLPESHEQKSGSKGGVQKGP